MSGLRGGSHPSAQVSRLNAHSVVYALASALAVTLAVLVIVLATSGGGSEGTEPVRVAPSAAPLPPSAAERQQQPGLNGPGLRP